MKKLVILGSGISGFGSAMLATSKGYEVFLSDMGKVTNTEKLTRNGVEWEEGGHTEERILQADEVIKSPGIPDSAPIVKALREKGVPIISEIEFAARYLNGAKTICITGSNGKSTTTTLIYKILKESGLRVAMAGNIGESFALAVKDGTYDWYVLEISSFQLDGMFDFKSDIAILLNITPDHLDRYDYKFENYIASKMRVVRNQTTTDTFIYMEDDGVLSSEVKKLGTQQQLLPFSTEQGFSPRKGATLKGDIVMVCANDRELQIEVEKLKIKGKHNIYNVMASALCALTAGIESDSILKSIYSYTSIAHRMEMLDQIDGVQYINDSKATNVDSTLYALDAMSRPTVWIAGGVDKGNDYTQLLDIARGRVHTLICMGKDNTPLQSAFEGVIPNIISTSTFEEAMQSINHTAKEGDVVLLSPACASFDLFKNFEHRGDLFKEWVNQQKRG